MLYIFLFILLAAAAVLDLVSGVDRLKTAFFLFFVIVFVFLSSIRWNTGPDWKSYFEFFRDIDQYTHGRLIAANFMEPGYTKLNLWVRHMGLNYTGLLSILAVFTIGLKAKVIYHHRAILMITLFLYYCYYLGDIASVRQFTAVSITLFSVLFVIKRKPVIFLLCVLLAATIHITSLFFLIAYWIYHREYHPWMMVVFLGIAFVLGIVNLADYSIKWISFFGGSKSDLVVKLLNYKSQGLASVPHPYLNFVLGVLKRAIVLPLFFWGEKIVKDKYHDKYVGYLNLLVFGNIIYFLFALNIPVIQRLAFPFLIFEIFLWGYLLISISDVRLRFSMFALLVLFGAFRLYFFIQPYKVYYIPFKTIF